MTTIETATAVLAFLEEAIKQERVCLEWGHGNVETSKDWVRVDAAQANQYKRMLRGVEAEGSVFIYTNATIGHDGYCHIGRVSSSISQLRNFIRQAGG